MRNIVVIGGGPAGMMAAGTAAQNGNKVTIVEKNERFGKKLFITGKGRCNVTNASDPENLIANTPGNPYFLYSAFYTFTSDSTISFFENLGVPIKVERGNRAFPKSDKSGDIVRAMERFLKNNGVNIKLNTTVKNIKVVDGVVKGVETSQGFIECDSVVVATGGLSYPMTGSTGDGFKFAKKCGHKVTSLYPSLVPLKVKEKWVSELMGLSLKNIEVSVKVDNKEVYSGFGEMLFTHFGVSGPLIISASSYVGKKFMDKNGQKKELTLEIDLKPALTEEQLDQRVLRDFEENHNRQFKNAITKLFPTKLIPVMLELGGIDPEKKVNSIEKEERKQFVHLIKHFRMTLTGLRDYPEAIITKGGVNVKEIDPGTMESKLVKGLYFAGEVLDLDALTGGFNLQIAWSTGYAAGNAIQ